MTSLELGSRIGMIKHSDLSSLTNLTVLDTALCGQADLEALLKLNLPNLRTIVIMEDQYTLEELRMSFELIERKRRHGY